MDEDRARALEAGKRLLQKKTRKKTPKTASASKDSAESDSQSLGSASASEAESISSSPPPPAASVGIGLSLLSLTAKNEVDAWVQDQKGQLESQLDREKRIQEAAAKLEDVCGSHARSSHFL